VRPLDDYIKKQLDGHVQKIEKTLDADVMAIISPILPGLELRVRDALEKTKDKRVKIAIILETGGGVVEVIDRIVSIIRHHYNEVIFIIPNKAMSAGTVFVMSGDRILMDYFSCLGPIDPQVEKDNNLVPALAYIYEFDRLNEKAEKGQLTSAEYALLSKIDLGELYQFKQARELSVELIKKWLSTYKFKNWEKTKTRQLPVTKEMKESRANEIAEALSNSNEWHSHGRAINMQTLIEELNLIIEDFATIDDLGPLVREYFGLLLDYMGREKVPSFLHTKEYF
jgi:hypothetical protein